LPARPLKPVQLEYLQALNVTPGLLSYHEAEKIAYVLSSVRGAENTSYPNQDRGLKISLDASH